MLMLMLIVALVAAPRPPQELANYLKKADSTFSYKLAEADPAAPQDTVIDFDSVTWKDGPWHHRILVHQPKQLAAKNTGILYITGDGPRRGDYVQLGMLSEATGMPVAILFNIPNQPIWSMREDDLIAHTFQKYIETGDSEWPLLFPMTKSALRAMDAVQRVTANSANPLKRFVVTGASKRGWTTWLVGASKDPRVIGIAPMVYDNLNLTRQMPHQLEQWGKYSEMIEDYTRRGLQGQLASPKGQRLSEIVDPYSYRSEIRIPTLIVNGGNDRYWAADAMRQYWDDLRQPKWARTIPNVGHDLGGGLLAIESIGAFARGVAGAYRLPKLEAKATTGPVWADGYGIDVKWKTSGLPVESAALWWNSSPTGDFRDTKWTKAMPFAYGDLPTHLNVGTRVKAPAGQPTAIFMEIRYRASGRSFSLTTPVQILKAPASP